MAINAVLCSIIIRFTITTVKKISSLNCPLDVNVTIGLIYFFIRSCQITWSILGSLHNVIKLLYLCCCQQLLGKDISNHYISLWRQNVEKCKIIRAYCQTSSSNRKSQKFWKAKDKIFNTQNKIKIIEKLLKIKLPIIDLIYQLRLLQLHGNVGGGYHV